MDNERTVAVLGSTVDEQRDIIFILKDIRSAVEEPDDDDGDDDDDLDSDELVFAKRDQRRKEFEDDEPGGDAEDNRSTSFRHFVGITEIQANLLIGILNASRAIQQESLDLWHNIFTEGNLNSSTSEQSEKVVEVNNNFNGDFNLSDSEEFSIIAERLANETISQMRAAGIRL